MPRRKIRLRKILANSLEAFFATLAGLFTADAFLNLPVPIEMFFIAALIPAGIQFGLTFCHEWGKAEEEACQPTVAKISTNISRNAFVCWCANLSTWIFLD